MLYKHGIRIMDMRQFNYRFQQFRIFELISLAVQQEKSSTPDAPGRAAGVGIVRPGSGGGIPTINDMVKWF